MSIFACIDDLVLSDDDRPLSIRGWITADFKFSSVLAEFDSEQCYQFKFGHNRPDVFKAFSGAAVDEKCGFFIDLTEVSIADRGSFWLCDEHGTWRQLQVNWRSTTPQAWPDTEETWVKEPPLYVTNALSRVDPNSIEENVQEWLEKAPRLRLRIDLINRCNLRCVMCHYNNPAYTSKPRSYVSIEDFIRYFGPIGKYVSEALLSCADEPLLAPSFTEVLSYISKNFPHVSMSFCTNGTLFTSEVQKAVIETGVKRVMVSLDGVTPDIYESIRKGAKFEKVLTNVINFSKYKEAAKVTWPELQLNFVLMRSNVHESLALVEVANKLNASSIEFHHAVPTNGIDMKEEKLENHPALYNAYRKEFLAAGKKHGIQIFAPEEFTIEQPEASIEPEKDLSQFEKIFQALEPDVAELDRTKQPPVNNSIGIAERYPEVFCELPFTEVYVVDQMFVRPCPLPTPCFRFSQRSQRP